MGPRVVHAVDVDFEDLQSTELKGLKDNYEQLRGEIMRRGMDKILENI